MMIPLRIFSFLAIACVGSNLRAEDFNAPRAWQYRNRILDETRLVSWSADRSKVTLENGGKLAEIAVKDLSEADRIFINRAADTAARSGKPLLETDAVFKRPGLADRSTIPLLNQGEYGQKASDCVPSSFCNFLLWWDQQGLLPIPKRGDFDDKSEWVHTRMARLCGTGNNSGTSYRDAIVGFSKYFSKEVPDQLASASKIDYDIRPENIARYVTGYNATLLGLTTERGSKKSGHMVALVSATPDGEVVFHTWGHKMKGRIVILEKKDKDIPRSYGDTWRNINATIYEIKIEKDDQFPDWITQTRFLLDPENWDCLTIVKPYVFAQPGTASPAPDDPLMSRGSAE